MTTDFQQTAISPAADPLCGIGETLSHFPVSTAQLTAAIDHFLDLARSAHEASRDDLCGSAVLFAKLLTIVREARDREDASMEAEAKSMVDFLGAALPNLRAALEEATADLEPIMQEAHQRWGDWVGLVDESELLRDLGTADWADGSGFPFSVQNAGEPMPEGIGKDPPSEQEIRLLLSALEANCEGAPQLAAMHGTSADDAESRDSRSPLPATQRLEPAGKGRPMRSFGIDPSPALPDPVELDRELWEAFLDDARRCLASMEESGLALETDPRNQQPLQQICRELHTLKGASASVGMHDVATYLHEVEDSLQKQCHGDSQKADVQAILGTVDAVRRRIAMLTNEAPTAGKVADVPASPKGSTPAASESAWQETPQHAGETIRVKSYQLDRLLDMLAQLVMLRNRRESRVAQLREINGELTGCVTRLRTLDDGVARGIASPGLRLSATQTVSSVTEIANDILEIARGLRELYEPLAEENAAVSGFIRQFRQELVELSRLPASGLFRRLQRAVRDAARAEGKRVRFETVGDEVGLDRSLQEQLYEPLLHVVRNSVSHGIEPEVKRIASGKDPEGCVTLAAHGGMNLLVMEVRDDGKGLDYEAIRRRGIELGLLAADRPASQEELCQLIFQPGFSTRSRTSETAGRGVGMDVVAKTLDRMRGWVELQSTPGRGTCIRLSVPLRSTIEHAMVFRAGGQLFGLPLQCIHRVGDWDAELRRNDEGRAEGNRIARPETGAHAERITQRNTLLPVYLSGLFGLSTVAPVASPQALILEREWPVSPRDRRVGSRPNASSEPRLSAEETRQHPAPQRSGPSAGSVVPDGKRRLAFLVEEIVGPEEVVVRPLPPLLRDQRGFSGVTLSGTGEVVLLLDSQHLCELAATYCESEPRPSRSAAPRDDLAGQPPALLVVDDSLSARRSLARMLQGQGFDVVEAADGVEALECMRNQRIAAVFTDLDMPRRSGMDLLHDVKSDPDMRSIPVVMVTGRHEDEYRHRARELGALAYLTKPFDAKTLADTLAQLDTERSAVETRNGE